MSDTAPEVGSLRAHYRVFYPITTRWMDNDLFGHVNNVTYYSFFDTAVNRYLIEQGGFNIHDAPIVGYVVHSNCQYRAAIAYPEQIEVGIRLIKLGNSSVTYGVAIFKEGDPNVCAIGEFVHVFVDRSTERPVPIPEPLRQALADLHQPLEPHHS